MSYPLIHLFKSKIKGEYSHNQWYQGSSQHGLLEIESFNSLIKNQTFMAKFVSGPCTYLELVVPPIEWF